MIAELFSAGFNLSMLPARLAVRNTRVTVQAMRDLPHLVKTFSADIHQSRDEAQFMMGQIFSRIDHELGGDPAHLSNQEREMIAARELALAEQHMGQALINMLAAYRVLTAKPSQVIEHGPAERLD
ncbi:hypothetical protein [Porticoccus sp.]